MRDRVQALARSLRPIAPDVRDVHVYGGTVLAGVGLGLFHPGAGMAFAGIVLAVIGLGLHIPKGGDE